MFHFEGSRYMVSVRMEPDYVNQTNRISCSSHFGRQFIHASIGQSSLCQRQPKTDTVTPGIGNGILIHQRVVLFG